ncbi:hypothetical protein KACHI17_07830 [Sediminibacterium sp. KACHI17]|uniref:DUF4242 domain-containing protein n=2 Tax=Sediminibacterium sp. KACHI17 TaxID=1751071 RepID=A0AAT9GGZ6_9BACT
MLQQEAKAQQKSSTDATKESSQSSMKLFLIERDIPGAGTLTPVELKGISQKSCTVLTSMGPKIKWVQSYVTGNKIFCVYQAEDEKLIKEHAQKGGFPITKITQISSTISPATAEQ